MLNVQGSRSSERYHFADSDSARSSAYRRPRTAPASQFLSPPLVARGSTSLNTYGSTCLTTADGNSSDINKGGANGAGRKPWEEKPLPLGPIPLIEGRKLRYPLLQLKREKTRAESACGTRSAGDAQDRRRNSNRQGPYIDVPVTTDWKGRWSPHLARVLCSIEPGQG